MFGLQQMTYICITDCKGLFLMREQPLIVDPGMDLLTSVSLQPERRIMSDKTE